MEEDLAAAVELAPAAPVPEAAAPEDAAPDAPAAADVPLVEVAFALDSRLRMAGPARTVASETEGPLVRKT